MPIYNLIIPGPLLISFITSNLVEAKNLNEIYNNHKGLEKSLHQRCISELGLAGLIKDDNITPEYMIQCCQRIVDNKERLRQFTQDLQVNVSTYYSVLSDGVVCIPWNFTL